ncbi:4879_t:CDS:2 [Acaulospora colombiana]|uniref:4879_t:CDS:1 n=1 Tax=Acaulospora colombiana TaxID=27376 RepID=A0ACA9L970_9GLOM|nr:4879_t:CDS:2 [Acaulospora colombiana]
MGYVLDEKPSSSNLNKIAMGELQTLETPVVTSKAEQPIVVSQHSLMQAVSFLRSELEKVQNEKSDLVKERISLLEQLEIEKNKNSSIEVATDINEDSVSSSENAKQEIIAELRSQIERVEKEKIELIAHEQQEKQNIKTQLDQSREEIQNFKAQLEQTQEERKNLKVQFDQAQEERQSIKVQLEHVQEEKQTFKAQLEQSQEEGKNLKAQLDQAQEEKQSLNVQFEQVQEEKQNFKAQLEHSHEEGKNLKVQLDRTQEERQGLEVQLEQLQEEKQKLKAQLDQTREEKQQLEIQHQSLIAKLANFKTSIADKLKTDMDLNTLIAELQSDLTTSRNERENTAQQLQTLETQLYEIQLQTSHEISEKEKTVRDLQINLDRSERERLDEEVTIMELKSAKDELLSRIKHFEREMETLKHEKETLKAEKDTKQSEIREAVEGIQRRLATAIKELAEFKDRAILAENQLTQIKEEVGRTTQYEKEIKEKNILIGKLRHEAVILNEHLTEALRRMREESSENNVDKRLITNLLIAFFNTPRGDSKRFEILQLMASMLQWNEEQKEQVGLIRKASRTLDNGWTSGLWTPTIERPRNRLSEDVPRPTVRISDEDDDHKESFSDMWISFLLKEANKDEQKVDNSSTSTQSE